MAGFELVQVIMMILYALLLSFIFLYSLVQVNLVFNYLRARRRQKKAAQTLPALAPEELPVVTVQLPIFNEQYVIERLIDAVVEFDYPIDKLEIQVLDDSTDETVQIAKEKVREVREARGLDIQYIHRTDRQGFKAGALAEGLKVARGQFVAIFDADFVPRKDFLKRTVPYFTDPNVGVVQTRWEHINHGYSMLTRLQAFGLDAHFSVEQVGRNMSGHFINFNGTAGIWRKRCIQDAGGWHSDTLTEDLDLSYRAQLKGWKFHYLEEVGSPAELPAAMNALKTQQFRWTKGAAECARKNLMKVLRSRDINFKTKLHAIFHLMNSFLFVCILASAILSVPLLYTKANLEGMREIFMFGVLFLFSLFFLALFYWVSFSNQHRKTWYRFPLFLIKFPMFLSMSMGLSLHNGVAVLEGYLGKKTPFVRTPKFNIRSRNDRWQHNKYLTNSINLVTLLEGFLALYFLVGILSAIPLNDYSLVPFHFLLSAGFGLVFYYSIYHSRNVARSN